jgi:hypothetical protein
MVRDAVRDEGHCADETKCQKEEFKASIACVWRNTEDALNVVHHNLLAVG